ncbi:hypothetical protein GQX74_004854 [Glossina fuscipes]|nr:hypothetical protein GQX74_004854 [Glossina fuscipes]
MGLIYCFIYAVLMINGLLHSRLSIFSFIFSIAIIPAGSQQQTTATLNVVSQRTTHQFCDTYEYARHDPNEFGSGEYQSFHCMLLKLIEAPKQLRSFNSRKSSPARTPEKTNKIPSLLDPSRLKPPPATMSGRVTTCHLQPSKDLTPGQHLKVILTLGLQGRDLK